MVADLDSFSSIPEAFFDIAGRLPEQCVYEQACRDKNNSSDSRVWKSTTYSECADRVRKIARQLSDLEVVKGDSVAILSQSRPEWMESDIAILAHGAVSVSIYQSLPADDVGYILFDSNAQIVFAENKEQLDKLLWLAANDITIAATEERAAQTVRVPIKKIIVFEEVAPHDLVIPMTEVFAGSSNFDEAKFSSLSREDLAALVYTSGTTGPPKGVMQTHGNHLSNCRQAWEAQLLKLQYSIMVFLPLAHAFAKLMGYLGFLSEGILKFPAIASSTNSQLDPSSVTRDIREGSANVVPIVPRLLEKMQSGISARAKGTGLQSRLLALTLWSSKEMYQARSAGKAASILAQVAYHGTSPIRDKVRLQLFGPNFVYAISGGAKLSTETARFFDMLGVEVCEGYGLTETCVATNVNRPGRKRIGTVGQVLDGDIEVRLIDEGEILFRGPNIAVGYFGRAAATAESWDADGWFHTGDLGTIDEDGYLSIVGRKKDILVTSYGKNIAPEDIEGAVKSSSYVSQAVMVGDGRPFCIVLVTLDVAAIKNWATREKIDLPETGLNDDSRVQQLLWKEIEHVNKGLAKHETMKKVLLLPEDFTVENGILTPTFKVKKRLVLAEYADLIEAAYAGS